MNQHSNQKPQYQTKPNTQQIERNIDTYQPSIPKRQHTSRLVQKYTTASICTTPTYRYPSPAINALYLPALFDRSPRNYSLTQPNNLHATHHNGSEGRFMTGGDAREGYLSDYPLSYSLFWEEWLVRIGEVIFGGRLDVDFWRLPRGQDG